MTLPQGINFRSTSGYVTDGANEYAQVTAANSYPITTPQGNNVGWESIASGTILMGNRSTSVDRRLAGLHTQNSDAIATYRIDLPAAGTYKIGAAFGDVTFAKVAEAYLKDDTTQIATLCSYQSLTGGQFVSAVNFKHTTAASWASSNELTTQDFSSSILRVQIGGTSVASNFYPIAHLYVESGPKTISIGMSSESDASFSGTAVKLIPAGQSLESSIALDAVIVKGLLIGQSSESDLSQSAGLSKAQSIDITSELDSGLAVEITKAIEAGLSHEIEEAHDFAISGSIQITQAEELNESNGFVALKTYPVGLSVEIDSPTQAGVRKTFSLELAEAADVALAFGSSIIAHIGAANELDTATSTSVIQNQYYIIATATESDEAIAMVIGAATRVKWGSAITINLFKDPIVIDMFNQPITIQ